MNTKSNWVYKLSVRDAEIFFETGYFKHGKKAAEQFSEQYSELFNKGEITAILNKTKEILRLEGKITELKAMYYALIYASNPIKSKERFIEIFGREYEGTTEDLKAINDKAEFFIAKLKQQDMPQSKSGVSFSELVAIVENSRTIQIDRQMKLFEFHRVYELELKKWKNGK